MEGKIKAQPLTEAIPLSAHPFFVDSFHWLEAVFYKALI